MNDTTKSRLRLLGAIAIAAGVAAALPLMGHGGAGEAGAAGAAFYLASPAEARVAPTDRRDRRYVAEVPLQDPVVGMPSPSAHALAKGEVVEFTVRSPRTGAVAVHGLLDVAPVHAGETITVAFRAIYAGRFPLHFHGEDGAHFEIAAVEVMPPAAPRTGAAGG